MQNNILEYKGYHTRIEFDTESFVLRGKIEGINDFVDFECNDISCVENEFHQAVDDYLAFCEEVGKEPEKEYKGTFNVRISPELHKKLALSASKNGDTLNASVEKAIREYISKPTQHNESLQTILQIINEGFKAETKYLYDEKSVNLNSKIVPFNNNINIKYSEEKTN